MLAYVPDADVLFTGDIGWSKTLPNLVDATVNDWIPSLEKILTQYQGEICPRSQQRGHGSEDSRFS